MSVLGGNCVGGGSVVYFAAMPRAPRFVFERHGSIGRRMWPAAITRDALDPWYDGSSEALPITPQRWDDVPYAGGLFAAACARRRAHRQPGAAAVDLDMCTNCNWMMAGCRFDAKRSLLLNYLPARSRTARRSGRCTRCSASPATDDRSLPRALPHRRRRATTASCTAAASSTRRSSSSPPAPAATPVILQRSEADLGEHAARGRPLLLRQRRAAQHRGVRRGPGPRRARSGPRRRRAPTRRTRSAEGRRSPAGTSSTRSLPEFERYSLEQLYFPPGLGTHPRAGARTRRSRAGSAWRRRRC